MNRVLGDYSMGRLNPDLSSIGNLSGLGPLTDGVASKSARRNFPGDCDVKNFDGGHDSAYVDIGSRVRTIIVFEFHNRINQSDAHAAFA